MAAPRTLRQRYEEAKSMCYQALISFDRVSEYRDFYREWLVELVGEEEVKRRTAEFESR